MQVQFMVYAFGGSAEYKGKDLKAAHYHLVKNQGLNTDHFDMVAGHFKGVLVELGVEEVNNSFTLASPHFTSLHLTSSHLTSLHFTFSKPTSPHLPHITSHLTPPNLTYLPHLTVPQC